MGNVIPPPWANTSSSPDWPLAAPWQHIQCHLSSSLLLCPSISPFCHAPLQPLFHPSFLPSFSLCPALLSSFLLPLPFRLCPHSSPFHRSLLFSQSGKPSLPHSPKPHSLFPIRWRARRSPDPSGPVAAVGVGLGLHRAGCPE